MSNRSEFSSNSTEAPKVSTAIEVRSMLSAYPRAHEHTRETWLQRAGNFFGLTPRKAKSIWYGEKVRIDHDD